MASAQANLTTTQLKAQRYVDLVKINGVSKQDADDAQALAHQAAAAIDQQRAALGSSARQPQMGDDRRTDLRLA